MTFSVDSDTQRRILLPRFVDFIEESFDETEEFEDALSDCNSSRHHSIRSRLASSSSTGSGTSSRMLRSTPLMSRRPRLSSFKSCESNESSNSSGKLRLNVVLRFHGIWESVKSCNYLTTLKSCRSVILPFDLLISWKSTVKFQFKKLIYAK